MKIKSTTNSDKGIVFKKNIESLAKLCNEVMRTGGPTGSITLSFLRTQF